MAFRSDYCKGCGAYSDKVLHSGRSMLGYCDICRASQKKVKQADANKKNNAAIKREVIEHYGGKCVYCNERNLDCLQIDHMDGNGKAHRKTVGALGMGFQMYYYLKRNQYPMGYQVLCSRHNMAKGNLTDSEFRAFIADTYRAMQ